MIDIMLSQVTHVNNENKLKIIHKTCIRLPNHSYSYELTSSWHAFQRVIAKSEGLMDRHPDRWMERQSYPKLLKCCIAKSQHKKETAKDGMDGLQSKFQNFNAKV